MVALPAENPVTLPEDAPTLAIVLLVVDQVPPVGDAESATVFPTHTAVVPPRVGNASTVSVAVAAQPTELV